MRVTYGPPGHKGVTTLMAVGADDLEGNATEQAVKTGGLIAVGAWGIGILLGNRRLQQAGFGAAVALFGVQLASGQLAPKKVEVTTPTPEGSWR